MRPIASPLWHEVLRRYRERRKLSRPELAVRAGVSPSAVKAFENGTRRPKEATLAALIDALGLTREEANPIRRGAGYADDWYALLHDRYPSDEAALAAEAQQYAWPVFVSNQAIDVVFANKALEAVMGVDLSTEFTEATDRSFLTHASSPRFVERLENFDEMVTYMIGLVKGDPRWNQSPSNPAPWLVNRMQRFMQGDPQLVQRVLALWQEAAPIPHRARHSYRVRMRIGEARLCFRGSTTIADLWSELSWNEWVPEDVETWRALEYVAGKHAKF